MYEANGYDKQNAPLVTLANNLGSAGLHDGENTSAENEIFLDADTVDAFINGDDSSVGSLVALAVHETTHVNQMDDACRQ